MARGKRTTSPLKAAFRQPANSLCVSRSVRSGTPKSTVCTRPAVVRFMPGVSWTISDRSLWVSKGAAKM